MNAMTSSTQNLITSLPTILFPVVWKRKRLVIRSGMYFAILAFLIFLAMSWKTNYQALIRVEPELTTTGETTSIEAEMDVIQSWAMITDTVSKMHRTVIVKPNVSSFLLHVSSYANWLQGVLTGRPVPAFSNYEPSLGLDYFTISGEEADFLGTHFVLKVEGSNSYRLYDAHGHELVQGHLAAVEKAALDNGHELQILISSFSAVPGDSFSITPVPFDAYARAIRDALSVDRKGFRERSGLLEINYANADPVFAQQFLQALVNAYISKAFDRSSLGKIEGLEKLEAESLILRRQKTEEETVLTEFKEKNQVVDLGKEQETAYKRSLEIQEELRKTTRQYKEMSVTLTDNHPSMIALRNQINFLEEEQNKTKEELESIPQKENEIETLQSNINIAKAMLDQNTTLAAQLHSEVETITGYAHLVSLYFNERLSPVLRGMLAILFGFFTGAMLALSWLIRNASPAFAHIRYAEDLAAVAPLPVVATLPFQWGGVRWLWYRKHDASAVTTDVQWKKQAGLEIERLEQEIKFLLPANANKTLLFTSVNGQGASFCAQQLAIASARTQKTLIIDANIMRPALHEEFECAAVPGLADILIGRAQLRDTLKPANVPNLFVLPAGVQTPNFRLLSDAPRMQSLLAELSTMFGRIIVEFPALTSSICQDNILSVFDGVFVVVNRDTTTRTIANTLNDLNIPSHKAAFFILNKR